MSEPTVMNFCHCSSVLLLISLVVFVNAQMLQPPNNLFGNNNAINQNPFDFFLPNTNHNPVSDRMSEDLLFHQGTEMPNLINGNILKPLPIAFPFYGGMYNYTRISDYGVLLFGNFLDNGDDIKLGSEEVPDWPEQPDAAAIAVYMCPQKPAEHLPDAGVYFRTVLRSGLQRSRDFNVREQQKQDTELNRIEEILTNGVAGGRAFQADAAVIVTWLHMTSLHTGTTQQHKKLGTYQAIWATNRDASLSYLILYYHSLSFTAADVNNNDNILRCKALLNGGNHTGLIQVDPSGLVKDQRSRLMDMSSIPDTRRGVHIFRVDDIAYRVGCTTKQHGSYPLVVYPNIVNMISEQTVEVNGMCMDKNRKYRLFINTQLFASCERINSALARCQLPKVWHWGTLDVLFQPESPSMEVKEKAFKGYIYFVPPTSDPNRLEIGSLLSWYDRPVDDDQQQQLTISWYTGNFTRIEKDSQDRITLQNYTGDLKLELIGYKEERDFVEKKYLPSLTVIGELVNGNLRNDPTTSSLRQNAYETSAPRVQKKVVYIELEELRQMNIHIDSEDFLEYRFGFFRLSPNDDYGHGVLISSPIPLHWLWTRHSHDERTVEDIASDLCKQWYKEDGEHANFIRDTETHAPCPCQKKQAALDYGRFMPHPRCNKIFRDGYCTTNMGSADCFMSAQNIHGQNEHDKSRFSTTYGQVCCYDEAGYLMHTNYQPIHQKPTSYYNPGFPFRAHEFGSKPFNGEFQVPGLSAFYHDVLPYFFCCKYSRHRCQLFYWRRPTSGCQEYQPPAIGVVYGGGHVQQLNLTHSTQSLGTSRRYEEPRRFTVVTSGIYNLYSMAASGTRESVDIQLRFERYPDRSVNTRVGGLLQERYILPSNATVVTGVAIRQGVDDADTTYVLLRKDTRRRRYRTMVVNRGSVRYFDTMRLQRFQGITMYVNDVNEPQSEVYVVIDAARVGLRIRESYAADITKSQSMYESPGLLDVVLSVPQERPQEFDTTHTTAQERERPRTLEADGLLVPSANDDLAKYLIENLEPGASFVRPESDRPNLFRVHKSNDHSALPADMIVQPVYASARKATKVPQAPGSDSLIVSWSSDRGPSNAYRQYENRCCGSMNSSLCKCTNKPTTIMTVCGTDPVCQYDHAFLQQQYIASHTREFNQGIGVMTKDASQSYRSCGAIDIEWPEYLTIVHDSGAKYLVGDSIEFECYKSHWIKGDTQFTCVYDEETGVTQWTVGWQPWCRSRRLDDAFKWLTAVSVSIVGICLIVAAFCVFSRKKQKRTRGRSGKKQSKQKTHMFSKRSSHSPPSPTSAFQLIDSGTKPVTGVEQHDTNERDSHKTVSAPGQVLNLSYTPPPVAISSPQHRQTTV